MVAAMVLAPLVSCHRTASSVAAGTGPTACDRRCLTHYLDLYLERLPGHDPSGLPLAGAARLTENGDPIRFGEGLWRTAGKLGAYRVYVVDPDSGSAAVQTVLLDGLSTVQILLRIRVRNDSITEVETLVAREGDTCCWAPERLDELPTVFSDSLPAGRRSARQDLVAIADAYFTALDDARTNAYRSPPVAHDMNRYENGKQTTNVANGNRITRWDARTQLDSGLFGAIQVAHRRYPVVDVQHGTLLGIVVFQYPATTRPAEIIAEFFKIAADSIRDVRAVMVKRGSTGWN